MSDSEPVQSHIDYTGDDESHGYTKTEDGTIWYWKVPNGGGDVSFRDYGYPGNHPYKKTGTVPDAIRDHAQAHVDTLIEQDRAPWA